MASETCRLETVEEQEAQMRREDKGRIALQASSLAALITVGCPRDREQRKAKPDPLLQLAPVRKIGMQRGAGNSIVRARAAWA